MAKGYLSDSDISTAREVSGAKLPRKPAAAPKRIASLESVGGMRGLKRRMSSKNSRLSPPRPKF